MKEFHRLYFSDEVEEKLQKKHGVTKEEVWEAVFRSDSLLKKKGQNIHIVFSQTGSGRYLMVFLEPLRHNAMSVESAREMTPEEKRYYKDRR